MSEQAERQAGKQARKATKTSYKPGQSGNPTGKRKTDPKAEAERLAAAAALPPGDGDDLAAMRYVMHHAVDLTFAHWTARKSWERNPEKFEENYHRLLRAERLARPTGVDVVSSVVPAPATSPDASTSSHPNAPFLEENFAEHWKMIQEYVKNRAEFMEWMKSRSACAERT